ncbi:MAG: hypothetical protein NVS2B14_16130 [Chamaesiphon sp.]
MDSIGVVTLLLTEREANFFWVLYERNKNLGIKSEDKLDGVSNDNKRTEETARELEPD